MSDLVGNSEDRFSHNEAQITQGRQYRKLNENEQQNKPQKSHRLGNDGNKLLGGLLAHLSQRLIGELVGYPWSRRPSVVFRRRRSQCSNIFFSKTAGPIKARLYVKPPWIGGTKFFLWHLDRITIMAATPMYGKISSKILCMYVCMYVCMYIYIYIYI